MIQSSEIAPLESWLPKKFERFIISGPCGAETREQVLKTAEEISKIECVSLFRAGVWKPRTRPNSFEGAGEEGLKWLLEAKEKFGLMTAVEVANGNHVEQALKYKVDVLWVGARTTVNPFSVQEIAEALYEKDVPVLIKNPIHADLQLWIGAIERILNSGNNKIAAIHRGFHSMSSGKYRYDPDWQIPIQLKTFFPSLPVFCDPSHISGKREFVKEVSQRAMDLLMDGLMIEAHISPETAWSDSAQQITPAQLKKLLSEICFRRPSSPDMEFNDTLLNLRNQMDELDRILFDLLEKRNKITSEMGQYKKENEVSIFQMERWKEILKTREAWGLEKKFDTKFVEQLCKILHEESMRIQNQVMNRSSEA